MLRSGVQNGESEFCVHGKSRFMQQLDAAVWDLLLQYTNPSLVLVLNIQHGG